MRNQLQRRRLYERQRWGDWGGIVLCTKLQDDIHRVWVEEEEEEEWWWGWS